MVGCGYCGGCCVCVGRTGRVRVGGGVVGGIGVLTGGDGGGVGLGLGWL